MKTDVNFESESQFVVNATIYKWLPEFNTLSPVIFVASHIKSRSFVQLSWSMSYAGTAICEISHLMLIAVSPIASQHRFHNELHDLCILYQNVWIKLIWQLKFIFKTPMLVWKEINSFLWRDLFPRCNSAPPIFIETNSMIVWPSCTLSLR